MESNSVARERRFKEQAERLREFLAAAGVDLKHTTSLQAIAHMHRAQDWRALLASSAQPVGGHPPAPSKFLKLTMTADSCGTDYGLRRIAVRVDQVVTFAEIPGDYNLKPKTCVHLIEPADWEADGPGEDDDDQRGGGVVRAYRQIYVRETFDEISALLEQTPKSAEIQQREGSA